MIRAEMLRGVIHSRTQHIRWLMFGNLNSYSHACQHTVVVFQSDDREIIGELKVVSWKQFNMHSLRCSLVKTACTKRSNHA